MEILITGGCGFIGTNLVDRMLQQPEIDRVRTLDNYVTGLRRAVQSSRVQEIEGDLRNYDDVLRASDGVDAIVHLGALPSVPRSIKDPFSTNAVNINGTLNVLEAARANNVGHVSVASSSSVYGANPTLPKVESLATLPLSPYAVTKLATEAYTNAYSTTYGLATVAFRFFNIFGPLQRADHVYAAVIPKFLAALKEDAPLTIFGDGDQSRDFTSIHAVTDALTKSALRTVTNGTPVNLAFGGRTSLNTVVDLLQEMHPKKISVEYVERRAGDVTHSQASSTLLESLLPDVERPEFVEALREVYDWYMGQ
ncbi:UDP-glucose 4-epimerase [Cryobacterium psychrotolerans]|uniref:UDP-glucose 4-epimerase n=1 Tax=Cryobacterium psychrotolerans TaxID=386301 RepID=A0A1G9BUZ4_9MICO|nr:MULTISPECIES: NAD-dependent epimerase/dehydratase family protein [Cryobacterium]TFD42942.1 NAD-dependent epimerase/dehydratase family protein [Cryobacterium sp. TMT1-2-1]TFD84099.1 NAD-dependent epimerase/dehydratase family protein [Cryobacterium psychrotolerans]SDK43279.1 UDP-glucose 4-epimerase [Cryobacterium psychrotolerans]